MLPDDPRHGTNAGYIAGCREECCRTAHATYRRGLYARRYLARGAMTIPAIGTQRRIRALQAIGWRITDIAEALDLATSRGVCAPLWQLMKRDYVWRSTAERVDELYRKWCMTPGPAAKRNRAMAERRGWLPPLAWDNIDDPSERPTRGPERPLKSDVDPVVVHRFLTGDHNIPTTQAEKRAIVAAWINQGRSIYDLEECSGWNVSRYIEREDGAA